MEGISESKLSELGEDLGNHPDVGKLGGKLGFPKVKIDQYIATNYVDGQVGCRGTHRMLFDWKAKTKRKDQIPVLKAALRNAGFEELADDYFPEASGAVVTSSPYSQSKSASNESSSTMADNGFVSEAQLLRLAGLLHNDYYADLASNLGFKYADYSNILSMHRGNYRNAYHEVLMNWKGIAGGPMYDLDQALMGAKCGALINDYKLD